MLQTNYSPDMEPALVGQIADLTNHTIESFCAEEALAPGTPVKRGTNPERQVMAVNAAGDAAKAIGVVIHEHKEPVSGTGEYYPKQFCVAVMTKGRLWVTTGGAVTAGDAANFKVADGTFVKDAVATGIEAMGVSCKFVTSTAKAGLAMIEIG